MSGHGLSERHGQGFTLIEVIVALGILTIGILALIPALLFNIKSNTLSRNRGLANQLAVQKLEDVRSWPIYYDFDEGETTGAPYGINGLNSALFGSEAVRIENSPVLFTRTTSVFTNGSGTADCGVAILFGSAANGLTRNLDENPPGTVSINTEGVNECSNPSGLFSGEDFRMVMVTITWIDMFGGHSINLSQYIRHG